MTELQLKIQKRADKTLSFWCFVWIREYTDEYTEAWLNEMGWQGETSLIRVGSYDYETDYQNIIEVYESTWEIIEDYIDSIEIIWHPMNYWRLCFLLTNDVELNTREWDIEKRKQLQYYMDINRWTFQQTILEWPVEMQKLVLGFLETLPEGICKR